MQQMENTPQDIGYILGDFKIHLILSDENLIIRAEHLQTLIKYSRTVDNGDAQKITNGLLPDIESLNEILLNALEGNDPESILTMDDSGKLTFSYYTVVGKLKKEQKYVIQLQQVDSDATVPLERTVSKLSERITALKKN